MFDRCRAWRSLLSRRAEGLLSPSERALLNEHLSKCAACLQARDADEALETACVAHDVRMSPNGAHAFDDTVIATLRAQPSTEGSRAGWRDRVREVAASLSYEYCLQLAGGALAAASVTAFALVSALNPAPTSSRTLSSYELRSMSAEERNDPPVPLEGQAIVAPVNGSLQCRGRTTAVVTTPPPNRTRPIAVDDLIRRA